MSAVIENTVEIARAPEAVFDYLSDLRNEVQWNPDCRVDGEGHGRAGRRRDAVPGEVEAGAGHRDGVHPHTSGLGHGRTRRRPISVVLTMTLERTETHGTRLSSHGEWTPRGWMRLFFPVFIRVMRRAERGGRGECPSSAR